MVLTLPLVEGTDGVQKMSKSLGNHIALLDSPKEMYGKVMSLPDALMGRYFRLVCPMAPAEAEKIIQDLSAGRLHPREAKARLAFEITARYHSKPFAEEAAREFDRVFKDKGTPEKIDSIRVAQKEMDILTLLKETGLVPSKMEARRLIEQGGVRINSEKVSDERLVVKLTPPVLIQCGKRKFVRVKCV